MAFGIRRSGLAAVVVAAALLAAAPALADNSGFITVNGTSFYNSVTNERFICSGWSGCVYTGVFRSPVGVGIELRAFDVRGGDKNGQ